MSDKANWEQDLVIKLAQSSLVEQRRSRRWGIFFKLLVFTYLFGVLYLYSDISLEVVEDAGKGHTAKVQIKGVIAESEKANADNIVKGLKQALADKSTKGVILSINSPGGSPVQAGIVYDEIMRLRKKYPKKPVYAVVSDICASGAYYIASAAEKIYADKASIVGSIGVRMDGFGFEGAMKALGIERRLLTAGKNKAMMDPFSPVNKEVQQHLKSMLKEIHQQFIKAVKDGRGKRLHETEDMFSGLIWTGAKSVELGLVDGLANEAYVARELFDTKTIVDYTPKEDVLQRFADKMGAGVHSALVNLLQALSIK